MSSISSVLSKHDFLLNDLDAVRTVIRDSLTTGNEKMDRALSIFYDAPGKMLRPAMVMLSSRFGAEYQADRSHKLAAAVELLHIASLVHDDIIDESSTRRGVATLHTTEGTRKAVLLGDFLFTRCFRLVADFASPEAARMLASSVAQICESEMNQTGDNGLSRRAYLRNIAGKTAVLFMLSISVGAHENEGSNEVVGILREAGYGIGMSFQIVDDILDYDGVAIRMGKPIGKDIDSGLVTLPLLLAAERGNSEITRLLSKSPSRRRSTRLRAAVVSAGGLDETRDIAAYYNSQVTKRLELLPPIPAKNALFDLVSAVSHRVQ